MFSFVRNNTEDQSKIRQIVWIDPCNLVWIRSLNNTIGHLFPYVAKSFALKFYFSLSLRKRAPVLTEAPSWPHKEQSNFKEEKCLLKPCPKAWYENLLGHDFRFVLLGQIRN